VYAAATDEAPSGSHEVAEVHPLRQAAVRADRSVRGGRREHSTSVRL